MSKFGASEAVEAPQGGSKFGASVEVQPVQDRSPTDQIVGGVETAGTIASGIISEPIAGVSGLLTAVFGGGSEAAASVVEDVREKLTFSPDSEQGQENLQAIGETIQPALDVFTGAEDLLGSKTLELTGSPELAAIAHTLPTAVLEGLGLASFKGASKVPQALKTADKSIAKSVSQLPQRPIATRRGHVKARIAELIKEGSGDIETAKLGLPNPKPMTAVGQLSEKLRIGAPQVVKDPLAVDVVKQGFDEGVVAAIKAASPEDQRKMLKMVDVMQEGKKNKRFAQSNRPADVAGDSLMDRVRVVQGANKAAGKAIDKEARLLKGKPVNSLPAVDSFIDDLADMGIDIEDGVPNFAGSDIEGLNAPEAVIKNITNRMRGDAAPDAHDVHRMKRFIDENVAYGKTAEGLTGKTEQVLKKFRRSLDEVLDNNFPDYDAANTAYAETIGVLDSLQDVAGRKMDLTGPNADKATGTLMRRIMGNAQSRVNLIDALDEIEGVANKYKNSRQNADGLFLIEDTGRVAKRGFQDDLLNQVLFADELDSVFKPVARTSLAGDMQKAVVGGANAAASQAGLAQAGVSLVGKGLDKARGINEANAFKAIRKLLDNKDINVKDIK